MIGWTCSAGVSVTRAPGTPRNTVLSKLRATLDSFRLAVEKLLAMAGTNSRIISVMR
jgi:hypothetical protein